MFSSSSFETDCKSELCLTAARRRRLPSTPSHRFCPTGSAQLHARERSRPTMSRHPSSPSSTPLQRGASLSPAMSSPRSNRSSFASPMSSSPYTSHPRLSIRTPRMGQPAPTILDHLVAPLKRGRSRRLVLLLAFASLVGVLVWRSSEDVAGAAAAEDRACRLLPWLRRCIGTGSHPLDLIHFERVRRGDLREDGSR